MAAVEILKTLSTIRALSAFLEAGGVLDVLATVEFTAARKAFQEVALAQDKRGQMWVCIGHLNSALTANIAICQNSESNLRAFSQITMAQQMRLEAASEKVRFLFCLLAFSYAYLGETALRDKHLDDATAASPAKTSVLGNVLFGAYMLTNIVLPTLIVEAVVTGIADPDPEPLHFYQITDEDVGHLRDNLATL